MNVPWDGLKGKPAASPRFHLEWDQEVYQGYHEYNREAIGKESKGQTTTESYDVG